MIYVSCTRCGSLLGQGKTPEDTTKIQREHMAECQTDP